MGSITQNWQVHCSTCWDNSQQPQGRDRIALPITNAALELREGCGGGKVMTQGGRCTAHGGRQLSIAQRAGGLSSLS